MLKSAAYLQDHTDVYEIVNLGESEVVSLNEMVSAIEDQVGSEALRLSLPMQPGDVEKTNADITKAVRLFGYSPATKFQNGIKKFVEWFLGN